MPLRGVSTLEGSWKTSLYSSKTNDRSWGHQVGGLWKDGEDLLG